MRGAGRRRGTTSSHRQRYRVLHENQAIPALQCRGGLAIDDPLILRAYLHEIAQACMAASKSALLLYSQPHHALSPHQQHRHTVRYAACPQPHFRVSMRRHRPSACLINVIHLHQPTWTSPGSPLQLQWLKWNSARPCVANTCHRRQAKQAHCLVRRNSSLPAHRRGCRQVSQFPTSQSIHPCVRTGGC